MGKRVTHAEVSNVEWSVWQDDEGKYSNESVTRAILLDIRSELRALNGLLQCQNFKDIPTILREIRLNTKRRRKVKTTTNGHGR